MTLTLEPPRFDWYAATVDMDAQDLVQLLGTALADERPGSVRPLARYGWGQEIRCDGRRLAVVYGGGQDFRGHAVATGVDAVPLARVLRSSGFPTHQVARCDVAVDTDSPGAFLDLQVGLRARLGTRTKARSIVPDDPQDGGTYYVGSSSSEVQARLYEKGKQLPDAGRPDWTRYEVQLRPEKERRLWAATAPPEDLLGAAAWGRRFASEVLDIAGQAPPVRSERVTDLEGALNACAIQYGGRFLESLSLLNGDVEAFALDLLARLVPRSPN